MMDGIEKVDLSIIDFFDECEKRSNINLGNNIVSSLSMSELEERSQKMDEDSINEKEMMNVNNFIFDMA